MSPPVTQLIEALEQHPAALLPSEKIAVREYLILRKEPKSEAYANKKKLCEIGEGEELFCPLYSGQSPEVEEWSPYAEDDSPKTAGISEEIGVSAFVNALRTHDLEVLLGASSKRIYRGLKLIGSQDELHLLTSKLLSLPDRALCRNPALTTAMAQKHETFFPSEARLKDAMELFSRAESCGHDEFSVRSRFRLALLSLSKQQYSRAVALLEAVYAEKQIEYQARVLYWLSTSYKLQGSNLKAEAYKQRLLKEYPLSYHTIALHQKTPKGLSRVMVDQVPSVKARSERLGSLNTWIRMVEVLSVTPEGELPARRILNRLIEVSLNLEPAVKLYLTALAYRLNDSIAQFRLLSSAFKDDTLSISWTTLKLFFPMRNRPLLDREMHAIDPLFLASLIRQESGFNSDARSKVGALGLMQLMPSTARSLEKVSKPALLRADTNIRIGRKYFSQLLHRLDNDAELALAAYNAGSDRAEDWRSRYKGFPRMMMLDLIPFKETRDYVALISRNYYWYRHLFDRGGFTPKRSPASVDESLNGLKLFTLLEN